MLSEGGGGVPKRTDSSLCGCLTSKILCTALTGVAQLFVLHPAKPKVADLVSGQGTCLGCRLGLLVGEHVRSNRSIFLTSMFLFLSLSLPSPLSKNK